MGKIDLRVHVRDIMRPIAHKSQCTTQKFVKGQNGNLSNSILSGHRVSTLTSNWQPLLLCRQKFPRTPLIKWGLCAYYKLKMAAVPYSITLGVVVQMHVERPHSSVIQFIGDYTFLGKLHPTLSMDVT